MSSVVPLQPSPAEVAAWHTQANNSRAQYLASLAQNQAQQNQVGIGQQVATNQYNLQGQQSRASFDDPYIARGIFNSGIRRKALGDYGISRLLGLQALQQPYVNQMGALGQEANQITGAYTTYQSDLMAQEVQRRADLATQIKAVS